MPLENKPAIFINYRRDLSTLEARLLYLMLDSRFPGRVFQDEESNQAGDDWNANIEQAIREDIRVCLVLIPPKWLYHPSSKAFVDKNPGLLPKLSQLHFDDDCHVRKELEIALCRKEVTVIPILMDGAEKPLDEQLPDSLKKLFGSNIANKGRPLSFTNPDVDVFRNLFDQIAGKADLIQQDQPANNNLFQNPLEIEFPLPPELRDSLPESNSPFVGLRPFHREDARIFFGRSREIYKLCHKILKEDRPRLLLLDGYSGTGKSSLLQAGLIPRIEAADWAVAYRRREEDKVRGLKGAFDLLLKDVADSPAAKKLLILDQVEEAVTDPVEGLKNEVQELGEALKRALTHHENYKIILGFRSEQTARITKVLKGCNLVFDDKNTLHPLERLGAVEAISGVARNKELNELKYDINFVPSYLPEKIALRLMAGRENYHIAPLLQVNMELLWQRCQKDDGPVLITGNDLKDFIDRQEDLLDHYIKKIREKYSEIAADDQKILSILNFYVQNEPASATRLDTDLARAEELEEIATKADLLKELKQLYLLSSVDSGGEKATRLAHDVLAPVIYNRYQKEVEEKLRETRQGLFEELKNKLTQKIHSLEYEEAHSTLSQMLEIGIKREELRPFFMELTFFWNEADRKDKVHEILQSWISSNLLSENMAAEASSLGEAEDKEVIRYWLKKADYGKYEDLVKRYLAPTGSVMVEVKGGRIPIGEDEKKSEAEVSSFFMANVPTTYWKYGLYLFATGQKDRINDNGKTPSWGVQGDHPVVYVSWYDGVEYCNWLSLLEGLEPCYDIDKTRKDSNNTSGLDKVKWIVFMNPNADGYRLPTEMEWEFAARGGLESKGYTYAGSNDLKEVGWYEENAGSKTHPVGNRALKPNELGLYDMSGNIYEWCWDWHGGYPSSIEKDYTGPDTGNTRVVRGGSWDFNAIECRVSYRSRHNPPTQDNDVGFRVVRR